MIKLGDTVTDSVTGFTGMAMGRASYLYGCVTILVKPQDLTEKGGMKDSVWIDEQRLTINPQATSGGPQENEPPTV